MIEYAIAISAAVAAVVLIVFCGKTLWFWLTDELYDLIGDRHNKEELDFFTDDDFKEKK